MSFDVESLFAERMRNVRPSLTRELLKNAGGPGFISFAGGLPNPKFFPTEALITATEAVLREDAASVLQYAVTEGYPPLREWIAARYKQRFGLDIPIEQILITSGSQQGLDLLGKVLLDPGDVVINERPGYQGAIHALSMYQPRFASVTLGDDGLNLDELGHTLRAHAGRAKFIIITPNYQNPTGITYSEARRRAIADMVRRHNVLLVEDDPYSELGFEGESGLPMRAYVEDRVVLLGSFSKIVAPGMRLGWLVAPPEIMQRVVIAKQGVDFHANNFAQRVLHRYLIANPISEHIARIRAGYASQARAMIAALECCLPPDIPFTRPQGGMFIWVTLPESADAMVILKEAVAQKVSFLPGMPFFTDGGGRRYMRLSYSQADEATIEEGISRLARVILQHLDAPATEQFGIRSAMA
ncbi:MAG: PLP-dependent aminotransferase family protein [Thermoflexales bacterium]|nr:PLP-dependent aminotransferase family protein [Thermoflexales bacterium]